MKLFNLIGLIENRTNEPGECLFIGSIFEYTL